MKKRIPFHPLLFGIFPVLSLYSINMDVVPFADLWRPLGLAAAGSLVIWAVLSLLLWSPRRAAPVAAIAIAAVYCYRWGEGRLDVLLGGWLASGIYIFAVAALAVALAWKIRSPALLNALSLFLVLASLCQIGIRLANSGASAKPDTTALSQTATPSASSQFRPDIFYVILDGYGRTDALQRTLGFSDKFFVDGLRQRGFYIADESRSNYCETVLSIPSSLNMDFIPKILPEVNEKTEDISPVFHLVDDNAAAHYLRGRGYKIIGITSGYPPISFPHADLWLQENSGVTFFEAAVLQMTPIEYSNDAYLSMFDRRRKDLLDAFHDAEMLAGRAARPRFVMVHILAPHPPFVFGPNGEKVAHHGPFGFQDGSDFMKMTGPPQEYIRGYSGQATFVAKQALKLVDTLLSAPGPRPVIIIQGDHGSKLHLDQLSVEKTDVTECFQNLSTYYVPASVREHLYRSVTPVNSFRILFNSLFGEHFPLLQDRSYYAPEAPPFKFIEVTQRAAKNGEHATAIALKSPAHRG